MCRWFGVDYSIKMVQNEAYIFAIATANTSIQWMPYFTLSTSLEKYISTDMLHHITYIDALC